MKTSGNVEYKSKQMLRYFSKNRNTWNAFYPSERFVFELLGEKLGNVLDVGCACGGLGLALNEKFSVASYTGVDIHKEIISWAKENTKLPVPTQFLAGDIIKLQLDAQPEGYDTVASLGCADWNIETREIIDACWKNVKRGGHLVISLRLTKEKGTLDVKKSYQYIDYYQEHGEQEIANYAVFNFTEALQLLKELKPAPAYIGAYGYSGKPSATAVTPFKELVFAVFYIQKGSDGAPASHIQTRFELPLNLMV